MPGKSLQVIDSAQDNGRVANWSAANPTPGAENSVAGTLPAFQPLWLNELQAENLTGPTNLAGQRTAWFELHNSGATNVPLSGLFLSGTYSNLSAWTIPSGQTISAGGFKTVFADGQTKLNTSEELHTPFALPAGGGSLALSRLQQSSVRALDFLTYTNLSPNRSYGSLPDGQSFDRQDFFYVTPGGTNDGRSAPLTVVINEWQAVNNSTVTNPVSGKFSDWFELYNYGTNPANLAGYFLTDVLTNKFKYRIPFGYVIPPGGFLLCWADDRNTNGTPEPHVSFKMSASGESLGLFGADGAPVDFVNYGPQTNDVSEGRCPTSLHADKGDLPQQVRLERQANSGSVASSSLVDKEGKGPEDWKSKRGPFKPGMHQNLSPLCP